MANITERKNKNGEVSYLIRTSRGYDITGKQIIKSMTWRPEPGMSARQIKKEVNRAAAMFETGIEENEITPRARFKDIADEWLDLMERTREIKISTLERMKACRERTYAAFGNQFVYKITYSQLQRFIVDLSAKGVNQRNGEGVSQKSQKHYLTFISDVMTYAIRCGIIEDNPCRNVITVKTEKKEKDIYTTDEIVELLRGLDERAPMNYHVFFHLLIFYGLRKGEALGLEWKDIDFEKQTLSINRTSNYRNHRTGTYTGTPKTKSSRRILKISTDTIRLLQLYQFDEHEQMVNCGDQWHDTDRLFIQWNGEPMHPNTPYTWLERFCKSEGYAFKGLHAFRHSYATTAITSNQIDIKTVSAVLGHSDTSATLNIYAHEVAAANAKAVDVVWDIYNQRLEKKSS